MSSAPINPVEVETAIRQLVTRISKGIKVVSERYTIFLEADRAFDRAFAVAYLAADGPVEDRKRSATLASMGERETRDVAEAEYKHADRLAKALELELRAMQSIGASVRQMYGVAGRGEW